MVPPEIVVAVRAARRNLVSLDDGALEQGPSTDKQLITRPDRQLGGVIRTLVLLVNFPDREHDPNRGPSHYDAMLFSEGTGGACAVVARDASCTNRISPVTSR